MCFTVNTEWWDLNKNALAPGRGNVYQVMDCTCEFALVHLVNWNDLN